MTTFVSIKDQPSPDDQIYDDLPTYEDALAERDRLRALNAELLRALEDCVGWLSAYAQGNSTRKKMQASERFKAYEKAIAKGT